MSHVNEDRLQVATYKEIAIVFATFVVILFFLYPKELIKDQILREDSNYDLSMLYLKNMLKHDPKNESLMLTLAKVGLQSGKKDISLRLVELLHSSSDEKIKKEAYTLGYTLHKENYYLVDTQEQKEQIIKKLKSIFLNIVEDNLYDVQDLDIWYEEAIFLNDYLSAHNLLLKKLKQNDNDIQSLERIYYLLNKMGKDSLPYLQQLQKKDKANALKWIMAEYYLLMDKQKYTEAEILLKKHSLNSDSFVKELAHFYNYTKQYGKASQAYIEIYNKSKDKEYLIKAIESLQAGNYLKESVELAQKYENFYINDKEFRIFLLKVYLAGGDVKLASKLAKKIMDLEK
ncbi:MAG: hypothetical protein PHQ93_02685 [Sulfurimonas sp.]|uniref:hypothetical protein n=1 Tax=Sulfurimonas sp. TaxID=2022749 RepID=UPI0026246785|nr:hypothetical protein [Sulfurimonas sp.]MDD5400078.1 hypothetical protein [Sulfurimonas sp.]